MITDEDAGRRRAAELRDEARRVHAAASGLEAVADEAERRLDPVLRALTPQVWDGDAARRALGAAEHARQDLAVAASSLREVAGELHLTAAMLGRQAEQDVGALP